MLQSSQGAQYERKVFLVGKVLIWIYDGIGRNSVYIQAQMQCIIKVHSNPWGGKYETNAE